MRIGLFAVLAALLLGPVGAAKAIADDGLITKSSAHSGQATLTRLEASLKKRGFMIFARLDHSAAAKSKGLTMPFSTVLVFGNPKLGTPQFVLRPKLAIDLPLKMLVWDDKSGKTWLTYNTPTYVLGTLYPRHGAPTNQKLLKRVTKGFDVITSEAVK
jgi:uncharacterized protein (DUF302 family)